MPAKLLAVWLDAAETELLEAMMARGELPELARLRSQGVYGRLASLPHSLSETVYGMVLTGHGPDATGTWTIGKFNPATYDEGHQDRVDYNGVRFFPQLDRRLRTCIFDVPCLPLLPDFHGIQVQGWGAHSPKTKPFSHPPELLDELRTRYGTHPCGQCEDHAYLEDPQSLSDLHRRIMAGVTLRAAAACDLLQREPWDLFFMAFGEPHAAGHYFWPHPDCLPFMTQCGGADALPAVYRAIDRDLGRIVRTAGPQARIVVFTTEGMCQDNFDVANLVLLPELLFRHSFPGSVAFDFDPRHGLSPEMRVGIKNWVMEVWHQRRRPRAVETWLRDRLPLPWAMRLFRWLGLQPPIFHPLSATYWNFQPTTWLMPYRPWMKAFTLITASDGLIRLNVRGREARGIIAADRFDDACQEIRQLLAELRTPDGSLAVKQVIQNRHSAHDCSSTNHDADLVVQWHSQVRDRLQSPRFSQVGPAPFHRASAHTPNGFLCAAGPGIERGGLATGTPLDVAATILGLFGSPHATALPGRCLVSTFADAAAA